MVRQGLRHNCELIVRFILVRCAKGFEWFKITLVESLSDIGRRITPSNEAFHGINKQKFQPDHVETSVV